MAKEWPQTQILDDQKSLMASSSSPPTNTVIMEKTNQQLTTPPPPLKCPRCDSSNTKFCYYNNYSLSQPRHFCKACKRYWTRGGTLRNVPVGGGCRKNKRLKRGGDGISSSATSAATAKASSVQQPRVDLSTPSNHIVNNNNSLFYGLSTNPLELNFPYSSDNSGFDFQMNNNGVGLGFSSSSFSAAGNFNSLLFGSSSAFGSTSTMASLLASSFQQQKFNQATNGVLGLMPNYEGTQIPSTGNDPNPNMNPIDQQMNSSDPSSLLWNNTNVGAWFDPSNMDLAA